MGGGGRDHACSGACEAVNVLYGLCSAGRASSVYIYICIRYSVHGTVDNIMVFVLFFFHSTVLCRAVPCTVAGIQYTFVTLTCRVFTFSALTFIRSRLLIKHCKNVSLLRVYLGHRNSLMYDIYSFVDTLT